jgi:large subunit ribosomal protein L23
MKHPREIIISPVMTEKSSNQLSNNNSYTFKVSTQANKIEIKKAIERIFSVVVSDVNTKRMGRFSGKRPDWKKAIVTLKKGYSIPDFEV